MSVVGIAFQQKKKMRESESERVREREREREIVKNNTVKREL